MGVNLCVLTDGGSSPDIACRPLISIPRREAAAVAANTAPRRRHFRGGNPSSFELPILHRTIPFFLLLALSIHQYNALHFLYKFYFHYRNI